MLRRLLLALPLLLAACGPPPLRASVLARADPRAPLPPAGPVAVVPPTSDPDLDARLISSLLVQAAAEAGLNPVDATIPDLHAHPPEDAVRLTVIAERGVTEIEHPARAYTVPSYVPGSAYPNRYDAHGVPYRDGGYWRDDLHYRGAYTETLYSHTLRLEARLPGADGPDARPVWYAEAIAITGTRDTFLIARLLLPELVALYPNTVEEHIVSVRPTPTPTPTPTQVPTPSPAPASTP